MPLWDTVATGLVIVALAIGNAWFWMAIFTDDLSWWRKML